MTTKIFLEVSQVDLLIIFVYFKQFCVHKLVTDKTVHIFCADVNSLRFRF